MKLLVRVVDIQTEKVKYWRKKKAYLLEHNSSSKEYEINYSHNAYEIHAYTNTVSSWANL